MPCYKHIKQGAAVFFFFIINLNKLFEICNKNEGHLLYLFFSLCVALAGSVLIACTFK